MENHNNLHSSSSKGSSSAGNSSNPSKLNPQKENQSHGNAGNQGNSREPHKASHQPTEGSSRTSPNKTYDE